jgi:hypothetical protein
MQLLALLLQSIKMKIAYIAASVAALSISFASADCDCDPYDTGCLNDCGKHDSVNV